MLVGGLGGRGVVAGASYQARKFGARSAMPMHQARRLIGAGAVVLPPRGVVYGLASRRVFETLRTVLPVIEQLSFDEAFGEPPELVGAQARAVELFCEYLRGLVRDRTGLVASVGAGSGKQIAKIASELAKPDGIRVISRADEPALLDGLAVRRLWGIGPVAEEKLHRLGIETIGQFAALTDAEVASILGAATGAALHRLARGIDDRPVTERADAKQLSSESTFATDLTTLGQLRDVIGPIAEHAYQRLRDDGRAARTVTVKLKKSDMGILTRSATLPYPTTDAAALVAVARRLLLDPLQIGPVRLLGVGFSGLTEIRQESLFPIPGYPPVENRPEDPEHDQPRGGGSSPVSEHARWRVGDDVTHPKFDHGWVQGAGHGVVTVRFETRGTGPGRAQTFPIDTADLGAADPVDSLDWSDYLGRCEPGTADGALSAPPGDDIGNR